MKSLSILHVNTTDCVGGAAQLASSLVEGLNNAGHNATMVVRAKQGESAAVREMDNDGRRHAWARFWLAKLAREDGSQRLARAVGRPFESARVLLGQEDFDFPAAWHLLTELPEKPDLIHLHNLHGSYFDLRVLPSLSLDVPTVVTMHDSWLVSGHCSHGFDCGRWRTGCGRCPSLDIYPAVPRDATAFNWRRKRDLYSRSRLHLVAPAKWLIDKAQDSMMAPAIASQLVINHGIDLTVFKRGDRAESRAELGLPAGAKILLFAAAGIRENIWKDYETMRMAFGRLGDRGNRDGSTLFLAIGESAPSETIGGNEIRFIPYTSDRRTLARYYQAADLYVHGARAEAWGLTITEAMACGLPVVASDVGGIPDQVAHGKSGFLVQVGDAEAMADRLARLLDDQGLREFMGSYGAERARTEFGLSRMIANYAEYYESIIAKGLSFKA